MHALVSAVLLQLCRATCITHLIGAITPWNRSSTIEYRNGPSPLTKRPIDANSPIVYLSPPSTSNFTTLEGAQRRMNARYRKHQSTGAHSPVQGATSEIHVD